MEITSIFARYQSGDYRQAWSDLCNCEQSDEAMAVAWDMANQFVGRAHENLVRLKKAFEEIGYLFADPNGVIGKPNPDIETLFSKCESQYGQLPLVIKAWYRQIGSVNFYQNQTQEESGRLAHLGYRVPLNFEPFDVCMADIGPWMREDGREVPHIPTGAYSSDSNPYGFCLPAHFFDDDYAVLTANGMGTFGDTMRSIFANGGLNSIWKKIEVGEFSPGPNWTEYGDILEIMPHLRSCVTPFWAEYADIHEIIPHLRSCVIPL